MATKRIFNLLFCIFLSIGAFADGTFYMFIVYDSQDTRIWAVKDKDNLIENGKRYASMAGMTFKSIDYQTHTLSESSLKSKINNLSVNNNDVFWFAYSGHGENVSNSNYPKMASNGVKMSQDDVHKLIKRKGARLSLTTFDCCNYTYELEDRGLSYVGDRPPLGYVKLFKKSKGDIKATAIKKGFGRKGYAIGTREFGGLFTYSFLDAIKIVCDNSETIDEITWDKVISLSKTKTNKLANMIPKKNSQGQIIGKREQVPYIEKNIRDGAVNTQVAPCYTVKEGDTKEKIARIITAFLQDDGVDVIVKPEDLRWCADPKNSNNEGKSGKIGSASIKAGDEIDMEGYARY